MNQHILKHGDVVKGQHNAYRIYFRTLPNDSTLMRCMPITHNAVYDLQYRVGDELGDGEEFVFNLIDLCASIT